MMKVACSLTSVLLLPLFNIANADQSEDVRLLICDGPHIGSNFSRFAPIVINDKVRFLLHIVNVEKLYHIQYLQFYGAVTRSYQWILMKLIDYPFDRRWWCFTFDEVVRHP